MSSKGVGPLSFLGSIIKNRLKLSYSIGTLSIGVSKLLMLILTFKLSYIIGNLSIGVSKLLMLILTFKLSYCIGNII